MKCNIHGTFRSCSRILACGTIFRDHGGNLLGGFSEALEISDASQVEIKGVMRAIEFSSSKGWKFFCLNVTFL
jgi:hypothetical protein